MTEKTHYRKAFNSPYLSSQDITDPTVLTIARVALEQDKTKKTKDMFNTAYFAEKEIREGEALKPMILNATNSRTLKELTGSHFIDDWSNVPVTVYVDANVRFGRDVMEGLRISPNKPVVEKPELTEADKSKWDRAVSVYKETKSLEKVLAHVRISEENQKKIKELADVA